MAAALIAVFSWPVPARAEHLSDQVTPCLTVEVMVSQLLAMNKDAEEIARFRDEEARAFMDFYNAIPPRTSHEADEVVLFLRPGKPGVLIYAFQQDCYAGRDLISVERFRRAYPEAS